MSADDPRRRSSIPSQQRAISTVLDAALFLLLVSAAIGILYTVPGSGDASGGADADHDLAASAATTIGTSIHTIEYVPGPEGDGDATQVDRGTVAELLAESTTANAVFDGEAFTATPNHTREVAAATRRTLARFGTDHEVQVRTRWRPLDGSGLRGGLTVGPDPPADVDVHAATLAVPVGSATAVGPSAANWSVNATPAVEAQDETPSTEAGETANASAVRATTGEPLSAVEEGYGCEGVARAVARRVIGQTFPPERTRASLLAGGDAEAATRERYERAADAIDVDEAELPTDGTAREYNGLLSAALADRLRPTACNGYAEDESVHPSASPQTVTVVVRAWSP